jgi:NAD-specific glutamate dehydrogenase
LVIVADNDRLKMAAKDPQIQVLRDEFRRHLEVFYSGLQLAPPYHSVEKAVGHLTAVLKAMTPEERARLAADQAMRWAQYRTAFVESGLSRKHRGIIAGLVRSGKTSLPAEYRPFLDLFLS